MKYKDGTEATQHKLTNILRHTTIGRHLGPETGDLAWGELSHAGIVTVVHEVICIMYVQ